MNRLTSLLPLLDGVAPECTVGVDEAGRGCLAGPVVAGAVVLPARFDMPDLDDSKALSAELRFDLAPEIRARAVAWGLGVAWPREIEAVNILQATLLAMSRAVRNLRPRLTQDRALRLVLIDGNQTIPPGLLPAGVLQHAVVGGDASVQAISAASVLAKTWRDRLMEKFDARYPGYGLAKHKGYGTAEHKAALARLGPTPLHRATFRGVRADAPAKPRPGGGQGCLPGL
ncbi:MAG: ribonuclease HII [Desulfovibrionaceae bacterium]